MGPGRPLFNAAFPGKPVAVGAQTLFYMSRQFHMGVSVRGALMNWSNRQLCNLLTRDDGTQPTPQEAKAWLLDQLALGHEKLPLGDCDRWDWKHGCPGHDLPAPAEAVSSCAVAGEPERDTDRPGSPDLTPGEQTQPLVATGATAGGEG